MIQQQPTNTLSKYKPFKISSILFIIFICIVIILTALTRTSVCNKYDCYQFGASYDRQCYSISTIYCCNYIYIFCGDAYCIPVQHHSNTYGNDCEGMLVALWVFLALCGLAILAIIGAAYAYRKKADADIKLAHRSSGYVPPPQIPVDLSSNQIASGRGEQDAGGNSSMRRQSSAMFNLQNQVLLL